MRRTGNKDENKRILMDLDVVLKSHDCPYIIQCYGAIVTNVSYIHTHTPVPTGHFIRYVRPFMHLLEDKRVQVFLIKCPV